MALGHNTSIVRDGLVFYYDMGNTQKSWRGEPGINYVSATATWGGDGANQVGLTKGAVEVTNTVNQYNGLKTFLWTPGDNLNCYLQSDDIVGGTSEVSTTWTFSCYVRAEDGRAISSMSVYMYYPSSDGASAGTITNVGNGWYRISRTRTGASSYISLMGFTGFAAGVRYYLSGAMLTKNTNVIAPLNGNETRSNTQAIVDLTNNRTITANSLTYNSDGTFSFNGSSNYMSLPVPMTGLSDYSFSVWCRMGSLAGEQRLVSLSGTGTFTLRMSSSDFNFHYNPFDGSPPSTQTSSTGLTYSTSLFYNVTATNSSTNGARIYVNGELRGSSERAVNFPSGNIVVGCDHTLGSFSNATIPLFNVYSKELTATEVRQNFEALRDRYGI